MIFSSRKTIGLFISKAFDYFDNACFRILEREGKRLNYDIVVFATVGYQMSESQYDLLEKNIFDFAPVENLDGILIVPDSFEKGDFRGRLYDMLRKRASCPVAAIRHDGEDYDCTTTDEGESIRQIVRHLIRDHGLKRICFQTGFPGHTECELRLAAFRQEMEENGLPVPENAVCPGTMYTNCGEEAYQVFFSDPENPPQAVVCGNDYMAVGMMRALRAHGLRVPEDVIVTGFDNMPQCGLDVPSLTTIQPDYHAMVMEAIHRLDEKIRGAQGWKRLLIPGKLVLGESCGCRRRAADYFRTVSQELMEEQNQQSVQVMRMNNMSIDLSACDHLEELHRTLALRRNNTRILRDCYLCLFGTAEQWALKIQDQTCLVHVIRDHRDGGTPMISFDRKTLLPPQYERAEEAQMFFVKLLHQQGNVFGYAVFQYETGETPSKFYVQWNVLVSSALHNIHKREELQALYEERRRSSITDLMTGLLNRRGFEEYLLPLWPEFMGKQISVVYIDLDRLKAINDHYGHDAGDYAIRLVGRAILDTVTDNGVAARVGGDEYVVFLFGGYPEKYIDSFRERLAVLNQQERHSFAVTASAGGISVVVDAATTIEQCLKRGDEAMYRAKEKNR